MKRTNSQYARLMEIDRQIRAGRYPNCITLAQEWEVSDRTVMRDLDFLRDQCGAPIEYDREHRGFRYTDQTWMLPSVMMSEGELLAVLLGSRVMEQYEGTPVADELRRVFQKLADSLPDRVSLKPELLFNRFTFTSPPSKPVDPTVWLTIVRGLLDSRTLQIRYRCFEQQARPDKLSLVNPCHLANLQGEWYVFGVHDGHSDVRQFAMARIEQAELTDRHFKVPAGFSVQEMLAPVFGRYAGDGQEQTIRLLFGRSVAEWVTERVWHPRQVVKRRRNGDVELSFPAKGLQEVQRWVLGWGARVRVLGPATFARKIAEECKEMASINMRSS